LRPKLRLRTCVTIRTKSFLIGNEHSRRATGGSGGTQMPILSPLIFRLKGAWHCQSAPNTLKKLHESDHSSRPSHPLQHTTTSLQPLEHDDDVCLDSLRREQPHSPSRCDSESPLQRIQCLLHCPWVNPSQCLASDFDLMRGILDNVVSLSVPFQCLHDRNHHKMTTPKCTCCHGRHR
jgi:hypothetical protein